MALFATAMFILDDSIDKEIDPDVTDYASDYVAGSQFRDDCISFIQRQLHLSESITTLKYSRPIECASFATVAATFIKADPDQIYLSMLTKDLEEFIDASAPEQRYRLTGQIPTVNQYWSFRHGVGCVFAFASLHQYVADTKLPPELAWSEEVMTMRTETSVQPCV
jgi:hypothetical protein